MQGNALPRAGKAADDNETHCSKKTT
jgi:hypothetical protein